MILIACVDDEMGMTFNRRRQSRDRTVCENMIAMCQGSPLYIEEYSMKLFQDFHAANIRVIDATYPSLHEEGYIFAERPEMIEKSISGEWSETLEEAIAGRCPEVSEAGISGRCPGTSENVVADKIVLYRWNRRYPADRYFPVNLNEWTLISSEEFAGKSHEKVTKEVWERA